MKPLTTVSGVRSSCDTLAMKSRRIASTCSRCVMSREITIRRVRSTSMTRTSSAMVGRAIGRNSSGWSYWPDVM